MRQECWFWLGCWIAQPWQRFSFSVWMSLSIQATQVSWNTWPIKVAILWRWTLSTSSIVDRGVCRARFDLHVWNNVLKNIGDSKTFFLSKAIARKIALSKSTRFYFEDIIDSTWANQRRYRPGKPIVSIVLFHMKRNDYPLNYKWRKAVISMQEDSD